MITRDESYEARVNIYTPYIQSWEEAQSSLKRKDSKVRKRLNLLLDQGSEFWELSPLAGHKLYPEETPGGGIITGIGLVSGTLCMIMAHDPSVKAGAYFPITVTKHLRAQEIAERFCLPCLYLVDSAGAYLPYHQEIFPGKDHFGRIFYQQARMSAKGIPQWALVLGSCTAGGAYLPGMADLTLMVEGAHIFLAGPSLVKAAIGENVDRETLGGAQVHQKSGLVDYVFSNEAEALSFLRRLAKGLPSSDFSQFKEEQSFFDHEKDWLSLFPPQGASWAEAAHTCLRGLLDRGVFLPFKKDYGPTLLTGWGELHGYPVGVLINNGVMFSESASKGAHFIQLCCQRNVPLIFLQNITGFMVGTQAEQEGIAKHGAHLIRALSCAEVPKFTVVVGKSYGAGNYAMCGRAFSPDVLLTWPGSSVGLMGGEQAANVMKDLSLASARKKGQDFTQEEQEILEKNMIEDFHHKSSALHGTARLWDDGIIHPSHTRKILGMALAVAHNRNKNLSNPSSWGISRF